MSLDDFVRRFLDSPDVHEQDKRNIEALLTSHLATGRQREQEGALPEAIMEYAKEHERPIHSDIDAEIAQQSYWHVGVVYTRLGDKQRAIEAFEKARDLWNLHHVGASPHGELAELLIAQGRLDEAIEICQEWLKESRSGWAKQLLSRAMELKGGETK